MGKNGGSEQKLEGMTRFWTFIKKYHLVIPLTIVEYNRGIYPKKRKIVALSQIIINYLFAVKFILNIIFANNIMDLLTGNMLNFFKKS